MLTRAVQVDNSVKMLFEAYGRIQIGIPEAEIINPVGAILSFQFSPFLKHFSDPGGLTDKSLDFFGNGHE
jgi:hypothetical protein